MIVQREIVKETQRKVSFSKGHGYGRRQMEKGTEKEKKEVYRTVH